MKILTLSKSFIPYRYKSLVANEYELMIHGLEFLNNSKDTIKTTEIIITLKTNDRNILSTSYNATAINKLTQKSYKTFNKSKNQQELSFILFSQKLNEQINLSQNHTLLAKRSIILQNIFLQTRNSAPDAVEIKIKFTQKKLAKSKTATFPILSYKQKNTYQLPMAGNIWAILGPASGTSYHRQTSTQEFAYDLIHLDKKNNIKKNNGNKNSDFFSFQKEILAPCDGTIVEVCDGLDDNPPQEIPPLKKLKKISRLHQIAGNFLVIKHSTSEFSFIAHCSKNSILVSCGDFVKRGQVIGRVGNSGNSTGPHLHFHLMDGPNFFTSRSLPIVFENARCLLDDELINSYFDARDILIKA